MGAGLVPWSGWNGDNFLITLNTIGILTITVGVRLMSGVVRGLIAC